MGQRPVYTLLLHRLCTTSQRQHATPIECTHIDNHLGGDPSQKFVVGLGSCVPSVALDTTLAPESPRTK